ncbi:2-hydroxyacid dehydrogenase, partial [Patulibacter sp. S7RM1-6]
LLGLGRIGAATARRLVALGARVVAFDPAVGEAPPGVLLLSRDEVVAQADVLSLHLPALPATRDMVDAALLARMPRGALLVNTARGELVVEEDLVAALDAGHLAGAALDTLRDEPPVPDHPLLGRPDVIVTPHAAPHTREAVTAMGLTAVQELLTVLADGTPRFPVPPTGDRA